MNKESAANLNRKRKKKILWGIKKGKIEVRLKKMWIETIEGLQERLC